ncbi:MAG: ABC transporter ATP-binding protein [Acidimicrobiia bacterium]
MMTKIPASSDPLLRAEHVSHEFGGAAVLHDVSLCVGRGEFVAIVGPSGCGKTTLLRACAGLLSPTSGKVVLDGTGDGGKRIGFVFQEPALLAWRRVEANARLLAGAGDTALVDHLLAASGLSAHRHKWPHELSGGMKMRLSLVRTLAARPDVLLLDEPFGALDQITRHALHDEFAALHAQHRFAALMVTHAIDEAAYLADRVLVMSAAPGHVVAEFTVPYARPRAAALRFSHEFATLCGEITRNLADSA